jgi:alpha-glucosidase
MTAMKYLFAYTVLLLLNCSYFHTNAQIKSEYACTSPDKNTTFYIGLNSEGNLQYRVATKDKEAINWSGMGIVINARVIGHTVEIISKSEDHHAENIPWPLGESAYIENNYNELTLQCRSSGFDFDIVARVFNGSIAFKYHIKASGEKQQFTLSKELTEFNLPVQGLMYQYNQESVFRPTNLNSIVSTCDLPATIQCENGLYLSVGEADNRNFTKCQLIKGGKPNSLAFTFYVDTVFHDHQVAGYHRDQTIHFTGSFDTPWRTVSISTSAIGLHDYSQLYLKLVDPLNGDIPVGVKPGKLIRAQLNTQSGLDCIDFAARHNMQYIMFDGGWYGPERNVNSDPSVPIAAIDMPKVLAYAKQSGIGVILYVNYVGLRLHLDSILPLYKKWGISGLKFGFVDGGTQVGLSWLDTAMQKVNSYRFILDVHDNYKPTGLSRRYPYVLTQEGIRGDENSPDAFHTTTLPFTRFLAGPADFTFCYPNHRNSYAKNLKVSMAQQLALTVIYFSPLQSFFWYGNPNDYTNESDIEFFRYVPTVWDESHYLAGEIGQYVSVARRKGEVWYMGNAAGPQDWKQSIKLDFLKSDVTYKATIYEDAYKSIKKRTLKVKKGDSWNIDIAASGGQAVILTPDR